MKITYQKENKAYAVKIIATETIKGISNIVGSVYLYILFNDLHKQPFGFIENIFVNEENRGQGIGSQLVKATILEAKKQNCYKIIANSRSSRLKVHKFFKKFNFQDWGKEFRIDL